MSQKLTLLKNMDIHISDIDFILYSINAKNAQISKFQVVGVNFIMWIIKI
jgi:hypothetical protein